ncbi:SDR family NAD(P)-dependent oxidoreductase, partial [Acinetobacter baumannii]
MADNDSRVIFVTGATGGIGRVAATRFASEGDRVVHADLDIARVQQVADEIAAEVPGAQLLPL